MGVGLSARELNGTPRWQFGASSALKGIYVIRYLLFSGGTSIAGAMVERVIRGNSAAGFGLIAGLAVGLILFRSQLRPLRWPQLVLSREALYLVQRKQAVTLPWKTISSIGKDGPRVVLHLSTAMKAPTGDAADQIQLEAKKFALGPDLLAAALERSKSEREKLPDDGKIRLMLGL